MAKRAYAKRYSQAVFEIAMEKQELDSWQSDLGKITSLSEDTAFMALLEDPRLRFNDKAGLLSERLGDINQLALNLAYLLVTRDNLSMAGEIADEYRRLYDSYRGIEEAEVTTAVPLTEEDILKIEQHLSAIIDKKVVVKSEIDTSIIGGLVARISGKLIDGSTRSRLEAMKKSLSGTAK